MESDMPWEGNIKIRVQAENAKMTLALRIPGWCKNYKISGIEDAAQEEKDGYLYLKKCGTGKKPSVLIFQWRYRCLQHRSVSARILARQRLCAALWFTALKRKTMERTCMNCWSIQICMHRCRRENLRYCSKMVETDGWRLTESGDAEETLYHMYQKPQKQKVRLHYIPYYTWANRGENEMQVWTRVQNP